MGSVGVIIWGAGELKSDQNGIEMENAYSS